MEKIAIKKLIVETLHNAIGNNLLKASIAIHNINTLDEPKKAETLEILDKNIKLKQCINYIENLSN